MNGFRLSPQQTRLWTLQREGGTNAYRARCQIRIEGRYGIHAIESSVQDLIVRHEILRTAFHVVGDSAQFPVQVIADPARRRLPLCDLSGCVPSEQEKIIRQLSAAAAADDPDLDREPGRCIHLTLLSGTSASMIVVLSALSADAESLVNFGEEICQAYGATVRGESPRGRASQYADIAAGLNALLESDDTKAGREYWSKRGPKLPAGLDLPFEDRSADLGAFSPHSIEKDIEPSQVVEIDGMCRTYGVSARIVILACWHTLIWRLLKQPELTVGVLHNGRTYDFLGGILGLFCRYLPLTTQIEAECPFEALLGRLDRGVAELTEWQDYFSWDQFGDAVRAPDSNPFFPVCFDFIDERYLRSTEGVAFTVRDTDACFDRFKVRLVCVQTPGRLCLRLQYDSNRINPGDIECLAEQYLTVLRSALRCPWARVRSLALLGPSERRRLLQDFNDTSGVYPQRCIHQLFESQVGIKPDSIAVDCSGETLTYERLNSTANQLARYLGTLGVRPGSFVALHLGRGMDMVIALLAVLKAGAAYVPLDPAYPLGRLEYMLVDSEALAIVTAAGTAERLPMRDKHVYIDRHGPEIGACSITNADVPVGPDSLAYVIYTSGTTGKPKGVEIKHRSVVNFLSSMHREPGLSATDSLVAVTSLSFDISVLELMLPMVVGAKLVLASQAEAQDPLRLRHLMACAGTTVMQATPATWRMMLDSGWAGDPGLKLLTGGEALPVELGQRLSAGAKEVWNLYGPTETTIWSAVESIQSTRSRITIGKPIANTVLHILDNSGDLAPTGEVGELYIGGEGLARGYLRRPALTAEKFVPSSHGARPGERLYRTGDRTRRFADGAIEYLGRSDNQVKIRGYRIELGEIEAVLSRHPAIRQAVVVVNEPGPSDKRLVAYIVPDRSQSLKLDEIRASVKSSLPDYMSPHTFVLLDRLPLTPNGKVDRKGLPQPGEIERDIMPARTLAEQVLTDIWKETLGVPSVSLHDNFFEIGGDSILSVQVIARANQAGLQILPMQIFQHPTLQQLAAAATVVGLRKSGDNPTGPAPLTPIQQWFFERSLPRPEQFNQAVFLQSNEKIAAPILEMALQKLIDRHQSLRLRFSRNGSGWVQTYSDGPDPVPFALVDLSELGPKSRSVAIGEAFIQVKSRLLLADGPIIRVVLFDMGSHAAHRLLIVVHHLAIDVISWRILAEDLQTLYDQLAQGRPLRLQPQSSSYIQWAVRLTEYAQTEQAKKEAEHWLTKANVGTRPLPVDLNDGANTTDSVRKLTAALDPKQTQVLLTSIPRVCKALVSDVLLTALIKGFHRWTGESTLPIDLESHGREELFADIDLSRTVGWFTSMSRVFLKLPLAKTVAAEIRSISDQIRENPAGGIGFGVLKYLCKDEAIRTSLREVPPAEVSFNYLGQVDVAGPTSARFTPAPDSLPLAHMIPGPRAHLFEITASIVEGQFLAEFTYSENIHRRPTVDNLVRCFQEELELVINGFESTGSRDYRPSDFPKARIDQRNLDTLVNQINRGAQRRAK